MYYTNDFTVLTFEGRREKLQCFTEWKKKLYDFNSLTNQNLPIQTRSCDEEGYDTALQFDFHKVPL